jgi:hypothetical protein
MKTGRLFLFSIDSKNNIIIKSNNIGSIDYTTGILNIDNITVTSTLKPNDIIEIEAIPESNDIIAKKSIYLILDIGKSMVSVEKDLISSGENTSGSNFTPESSYLSGTKIRN